MPLPLIPFFAEAARGIVGYSFYKSVWNALFPIKVKAPKYRPAYDAELPLGDDALPVAYGLCELDCPVIYREDTTGTDYEMAALICDGPIESIDRLTFDGIPEDEFGTSALAVTEYTGTPDQAADEIFESGTFTLKASQDAYVDSSNPDTNYGSEEELYIRSTIGTLKQLTFMEFDLGALPAGLTIENVYLCLAQTAYSAIGYSGKVVAASGSWDEDTVTWNTMPDINWPSETDYSDLVPLSRKKTQQILLNAAGKSAVETVYGSAGTITLALEKNDATGDAWMKFDSRQGANAPYLKVVFSGGDPCAFRDTAYITASVTESAKDKKILSRIPRVRARIHGKKVRVWDTDDEVWSRAFSRNPVWQVLDIMAGERYAEQISDTWFDLDTFITAAAYCDQPVTRPDGATEPRYQCDIAFVNVGDKRSAIMAILATFGGYLYDQDGKIAIGCETAESAPYDHSFTTSGASRNIIPGTVQRTRIDEENIPNQVKVLYTDIDNDYQLEHAIAEDRLDIERRGEKPLELNLVGITRQSQAARMANWYLWRAKLCNEQDTFEVAWKDVEVNGGDLADLTDDATGLSAQPVRILLIEAAESGNAKITAEIYDASIHNDTGQPDDFNTRPQLPKEGLPPDVTSLTVIEDGKVMPDGTYIPVIRATWDWPTEFYHWGLMAIVWVKKDDGDWYQAMQLYSESEALIYVNDGLGLYYVKVQMSGRKNGLFSDFDNAPTESVTVSGPGLAQVPRYMGFELTTNSRAEWTTGTITYKGVAYSVASGYTTDRYIWWDPDIDGEALQSNSTKPALGANGFWFAFYDSASDTVEMAQTYKMLNVEVLKAGSIDTSLVSFTVAGTGNIVGMINASSEGLRIAANKIQISGDVTFSAGYDPTTKLATADAGDLATKDKVGSSDCDTTLIVGGYIKSGLVVADNVVSGTFTGLTYQSAASGARALIEPGTGGHNFKSYLSSGALVSLGGAYATGAPDGLYLQPDAGLYVQFGTGPNAIYAQLYDDGLKFNGYAYGNIDGGPLTTTMVQIGRSGDISLLGNITMSASRTVDGVDISAFKSAYDSHAHAFSAITSKPTTLSGYGITDAASSSHNHDGTYHPYQATTFTGQFSDQAGYIISVTNGIITARNAP